MEKNSTYEHQNEIDNILIKIQPWKNLFFITVEHYFDGWAIFLKEKNIYPRNIVIFKAHYNNIYTLKSFEIITPDYGKEEYKELYFNEYIPNPEVLLRELKEVIYGKDLINSASQHLFKSFST